MNRTSILTAMKALYNVQSFNQSQKRSPTGCCSGLSVVLNDTLLFYHTCHCAENRVCSSL